MFLKMLVSGGINPLQRGRREMFLKIIVCMIDYGFLHSDNKSAVFACMYF